MEDVLKLAGVLAAVMGVPMLIVAVVPALGKALARRLGATAADPGVIAELEQLRERVQLLEEREGRMTELEERLDFAERVIAQSGDRQIHG